MGFSVVIPTSANMTASVAGEAVLAAITGANATLTASVAIPGPQGPQGPQGNPGTPGTPGVGVPAGGTAGQILAKIDGVNYNTHWIDDAETVVWGDIGGSLANQTDLQSALDGKYSTSNPSGFITSAALTPYLTTASAAATYYLQTNPSGFITSAALAGYATESWVTSQGYITSSALTPYLTKADNLGSLTNFATARDNLGLGLLNSPTFAALTIQGAGSNIANLGATFLTLSQPGYGQFTIQPSQGIVFPDASIQTTAYPGPPGATTWGSITGTLSSQTDLQTALDGKYSTTNPAGYITSSALTPYLLSSTAAATYQTIAGMSDYAQLSGATFTGNVFAPTPSPGTDSTRIATTEWVKDFDYAPTNSPHFTGNPQSVTPNLSDNDTSIATTAFVKGQGYLTSSALTGYATESWVTSQGYLTDALAASTYYPLSNPSGFIGDAPSDGQQYARKDGAWDIVSGGGSSYITSVTSPLAVSSGDLSIDLSEYAPLNTPANFTSDVFVAGIFSVGVQGFPEPSGFTDGSIWYQPSLGKLRSVVNNTYVSVATESWVTSLGYATSSGVAANYAPLASPALTGVPTAPTASLGTNTTQIATTAFVIANAGGGGGGGGVDIQTFGGPTSSGTFTWTKPAGAKLVDIYLFGGGGGGASGARQPTTTNRAGGNGGGGGTFYYNRISADSLNSTQSVVIGSGGSGALARTTNGTILIGVAGGQTTFSSFRASGGKNSNAGSISAYSISLTSAIGGGGNTSTTNGLGGQFAALVAPTGGGGGAGQIANTTNSTLGGNGGYMNTGEAGLIAIISGGSGGTTTGVAATAGFTETSQLRYAGTGGGGGAYRSGFPGGDGANGGWPGGGGGGGGASNDGFNSGKGGNGANGYAVIITYF